MKFNRSLLLFLICIFANLSFAQDSTSLVLIGEGSEYGVKLHWMPNSWTEDVTGIVIQKRRKGSSNWQQLSSSAIFPAYSANKDLSNCTNNSNEVSRLLAKRTAMLNQQDGMLNVRENSVENFRNLLNNASSRRSISVFLSLDFDAIMMCGFGFNDVFESPKNIIWEYGAFINRNGQIESEPSALYEWNSNEPIDLKIPVEFKSKRKRREIILTAKIDSSGFRSLPNITRFAVYRRTPGENYQKINKERIWMDNDDYFIYFNDEVIQRDLPYTYSIVPVTVFNTQGKFSDYSIQVTTKEASEIKPAQLDSVWEGTSTLELNWNFNPNEESEIETFLLQLRSESEVIQVDSIKPKERSFSYPKPKGKKYLLELITITKEGIPYLSESKAILLKHLKELNRKIFLKGEYIANSRSIQLHWADPLDTTYYVMCDYAKTNALSLEKDFGLLTNKQYSFQINSERGGIHHFCIAGMSADSDYLFSDTLEIRVPNTSIVPVSITDITISGDKVWVEWDYPKHYYDLQGFVIYENGKKVVGVEEARRSKRYISYQTSSQGKRSIEMEAVTEFGIKSDRSIAYKITKE